MVKKRTWSRWALWILAGLVVAFGLAQLVPYGRAGNPPVTQAAEWTSPEAERIAQSACYDCHSNLTKRWWATKVAPSSWLAQHDVDGGREALNFSEWDKPQAELDEIVEVIREGGMPPWQYKLMHGSARLSDSERRTLVAGVEALYAHNPPAGVKKGGD